MKNVTKQHPDNSPIKKLYVGLAFLFLAVLATVIILILPAQSPKNNDEPHNYEFKSEGSAFFYDFLGNQLCSFEIEIADNADRMKTGLMYRDSLAENQGMLFLYDKPDILSFWMKNTYLSLDIVYISSDSTIVSIGENTTPFSEQAIVSKGPAQYVLEINAGLSQKLNLNIGNKFKWIRN